MQIIQKDDEIADLKESLAALRAAMKAMQTSNEKQQLEATALWCESEAPVKGCKTGEHLTLICPQRASYFGELSFEPPLVYGQNGVDLSFSPCFAC